MHEYDLVSKLLTSKKFQEDAPLIMPQFKKAAIDILGVDFASELFAPTIWTPLKLVRSDTHTVQFSLYFFDTRIPSSLRSLGEGMFVRFWSPYAPQKAMDILKDPLIDVFSTAYPPDHGVAIGTSSTYDLRPRNWSFQLIPYFSPERIDHFARIIPGSPVPHVNTGASFVN